MKAGRHDGEAEAESAFHTGAIVGADDVFDAAMRRAGVLRIRDFSELYTAAATLGAGVRVGARRLAVVSNAGGPGAIAVDRAEDRWLRLAPARGRLRHTAAGLAAAHRRRRQSRLRARRCQRRAVRRGGRHLPAGSRRGRRAGDPRAARAHRARHDRRGAARGRRSQAQAALHVLDGRRRRRGEPPPLRRARRAELRAARGRRGRDRRARLVRLEPAAVAAGAGTARVGLRAGPRHRAGRARRRAGERAGVARSRGLEGGARGIRRAGGAQPAGALRHARPRG